MEVDEEEKLFWHLINYTKEFGLYCKSYAVIGRRQERGLKKRMTRNNSDFNDYSQLLLR